MNAKVVVVGAGPGGAAAAIALAQRGITDVLLIDRARFPRDKTCGSAISPLGLRVLEELGLRRDVAARGYPIRSLLLTTPGGRQISGLGLSFQLPAAGFQLPAASCPLQLRVQT